MINNKNDTIDTVKNNIPWVEKYRPTKFDDIVLEPMNRTIFQRILEKDYFPNLLFYGPPGTGKTTTIINLIHSYQKKNNQVSKGTIIHLNASDERGIDIIRNQIYQFVRTKNLFETGLKFVILDEVDYMTKNAQQAMKILLQTSSQNVRFCLICNYISKIDESLKNEFISIRFNQLPKNEIYDFLKNIALNEGIILSDTAIDTIQKIYQSDIRSMINFIQLHQNMMKWETTIISDAICSQIFIILTEINPTNILHDNIKKSKNNKNNKNNIQYEKKYTYENFSKYMHDTSIQYNTDKRNILKYYCNYIIRQKRIAQDKISEFLQTAEFIVHVSNDAELEDILKFTYHNLH
jgi:replication factor C subunit 3/5